MGPSTGRGRFWADGWKDATNDHSAGGFLSFAEKQLGVVEFTMCYKR